MAERKIRNWLAKPRDDAGLSQEALAAAIPSLERYSDRVRYIRWWETCTKKRCNRIPFGELASAVSVDREQLERNFENDYEIINGKETQSLNRSIKGEMENQEIEQTDPVYISATGFSKVENILKVSLEHCSDQTFINALSHHNQINAKNSDQIVTSLVTLIRTNSRNNILSDVLNDILFQAIDRQFSDHDRKIQQLDDLRNFLLALFMNCFKPEDELVFDEISRLPRVELWLVDALIRLELNDPGLTELNYVEYQNSVRLADETPSACSFHSWTQADDVTDRVRELVSVYRQILNRNVGMVVNNDIEETSELCPHPDEELDEFQSFCKVLDDDISGFNRSNQFVFARFLGNEPDGVLNRVHECLPSLTKINCNDQLDTRFGSYIDRGKLSSWFAIMLKKIDATQVREIGGNREQAAFENPGPNDMARKGGEYLDEYVTFGSKLQKAIGTTGKILAAWAKLGG